MVALAERYSHIQFRQHWTLSPQVQYQLGQCQAVISGICEMPLRPEYHQRLLKISLIKGAQATTAIEGNTLTDDEVRRVADGEILAPSKEYQRVEVANILDAMNRLLQEVADEGKTEVVSAALILRFHKLIGQNLGDHFDAIPGELRHDERVVGTYRCPRHEDVPTLVQQLCEWLPNQFGFATGRQTYSDAVIQAIVTHVYLEWIHPFGDGNGRTGRLLEFYVLLRAGNPDIASHILSNFYNSTRPEYYRQLDRACKTRDLSAFIEYAVQGFRDGLLETLNSIQKSQFATAWRSLIYDKFAEHKYRKRNVFKRRRELMLSLPLDQRIPFDQITAVSPEITREYATLSPRTLVRDLAFLKEMGLVEDTSEGWLAKNSVLKLQMARRRRQQ